MIEAQALAEARKSVYRAASWVMLAAVLLALIAAGAVLPATLGVSFIAPLSDMGRALPGVTQLLVEYCGQRNLLLAAGLIGVVLVVKEVLAAPKVRFWVNVVALLVLVAWMCAYVVTISLPWWQMLQPLQGP